MWAHKLTLSLQISISKLNTQKNVPLPSIHSKQAKQSELAVVSRLSNAFCCCVFNNQTPFTNSGGWYLANCVVSLWCTGINLALQLNHSDFRSEISLILLKSIQPSEPAAGPGQEPGFSFQLNDTARFGLHLIPNKYSQYTASIPAPPPQWVARSTSIFPDCICAPVRWGLGHPSPLPRRANASKCRPLWPKEPPEAAVILMHLQCLSNHVTSLVFCYFFHDFFFPRRMC